jgi:hypothetical protein
MWGIHVAVWIVGIEAHEQNVAYLLVCHIGVEPEHEDCFPLCELQVGCRFPLQGREGSVA